MAEIVWRKKAKKQQRKVLLYGEQVFGRHVAQKLYDQIIRSVLLLAANPYMGSLEPLLAARQTPYRSLVVHEHYKLIYWVDENKEILYVSDLWDTRREPQSLTEGTPNK